MIVTMIERMGAPRGARVRVTHHRRPHGISGNRIQPCDDHPWLGQFEGGSMAAPRPLATAHRADTVNNRQVNGAGSANISHNVRHSVASFLWDVSRLQAGKVELLKS